MAVLKSGRNTRVGMCKLEISESDVLLADSRPELWTYLVGHQKELIYLGQRVRRSPNLSG